MRHWFLYLMLCMLSLGVTWGTHHSQIDELERRVNDLEKKTAKPYSIPPLCTPCAGPRVKNGKDIHLAGDYIYWKPKIDGLIYAKTGVPVGSQDGAVKEGTSYAVSFGQKPGFKGEVGWTLKHGGWDILFEYTHFCARADHILRNLYCLPYCDPLRRTMYSTYVAFARARSSLRYQIGDLEIGRNYYVSRTLKLRPHVGAKGAYHKETFQFESMTEPDVDLYLLSFLSQSKQDCWGVGMRSGMKSSWQFSKHFGLYGNVACSGMWLTYVTERKDTGQKGLDIHLTRLSFLNMHSRFRMIKPVIEVACGLRAEAYSKSGRSHMLLQLVGKVMYGSIKSCKLEMMGGTLNPISQCTA